MALKRCGECRGKVSTRASKCPHCGAPLGGFWTKQRSGCGCIVVLIVAGILGWSVLRTPTGAKLPEGRVAATREQEREAAQAANARRQAEARSSENKSRDKSADDSLSNDPQYPVKLVKMLSDRVEFAGAQCGLTPDENGWHKSKTDDVWNAVLRRSFGQNEVSCLLESESETTVQRIELEAEFYLPRQHEAAMLLQFSQSAQVLMYPVPPPVAFAEAVANKGNWSNDQWELTRYPYANGGFGLMLRRNLR